MKLEELTNKIYAEGVEKGNAEAKEIVAKAEEQAAQIMAEAKKQAEQCVQAAQQKAAELDKIANNPALLFAAIKEPLATVYRVWREKDVFARIGDGELAQVAATLNELSSAATAALKARSK